LVLAALAASGACGDRRAGPSDMAIRIAAAASLTDALTEVAGLFERDTGIRCKLNFASSSLLAKQIGEGLASDLFFSASPAWAKYIEEKGLLIASSIRPILHNSLVVVVPEASDLTISSLKDLAGGGIRRISAGDPGHVPAGIYARKALEKAGLWGRIESKVVGAVDVRAALAFVENSAVDCGITYATDARISDKVRIAFLFPPDLSPDISYIVGIVKGENAEANSVKVFMDFIFSTPASKVFQQHGFETKWD